MAKKSPKAAGTRRKPAVIDCSGNTEVPFVGVPISEVHINPEEIPEADYEIGCRILAESVRRFFEDPRVQADFEVWKEKRKQSAVAEEKEQV